MRAKSFKYPPLNDREKFLALIDDCPWGCEMRPLGRLVDSLMAIAGCEEILPRAYCYALRLPSGTTYGEASDALWEGFGFTTPNEAELPAAAH